MVKMTTSLHETTHETTHQTTHQQPATPPVGTTGGVDAPPTLIDQLMARGVTGRIARQLVADYPAAHVARHIDIYDHRGALEPDDPNHHGGRLRCMIRDNWPPPPTWEGPEIRADRVAAVEAERAARAVAEAERVAQDQERYAATERRFVRLGTTSEEQSALRRLINTTSRFELGTAVGTIGRLSALGDAFNAVVIRVSDDGEGAIVAVPDQRALDSIMSAANRRRHDLLELRLRDRYPTCKLIRYTTDEELIQYLDGLEPTVAEEARPGRRGRPHLASATVA